jgi:thiol-disulfide isomerase/thioredoxin
MNKKNLLTMLAFSMSVILHSQENPASADAILKDAYREAAASHKNVFVIFHASWCGWCKKMDASINDPACKKFFDDNFVIRHLVVYESPDKKNLENPGAMDLLKKYKGDDNGIPYWLIFDSQGNLLADSKRREKGAGPDATGDNTGCPASETEVGYFVEVLRHSSGLDEAQLTIIANRFRKNESGGGE